MSEAISSLPITSSWSGDQLKHRDYFTLLYFTFFIPTKVKSNDMTDSGTNTDDVLLTLHIKVLQPLLYNKHFSALTA
jgi:hypothetical protein